MSDPAGGASSELMAERIAAVRGCAMLFSKGLSDLHAVDIKNLDVYLVKLERAHEISDVLLHVQRLIGPPPLWLRRALGTEPPLEAA